MDEEFIIIKEVSEYMSGDHSNDPGYTKQYKEATVYTDRQKWTKEIERLTKRQEVFKAYIAHPVTVTTTVHINIA